VLCNAVRGISDLITIRGNINVDFADVRTILTNRGRALMGTGYGRGDHRALEAAQMAVNSPLLEDVKIDGATGLLINITGGPDMTMNEVAEAISMIEEVADEDAHIIFGYVTLDEPCEEIKVTVIATGFQHDEALAAAQSRRAATVQPSFTARATAAAATAATTSQSRMSGEWTGRTSQTRASLPAGRVSDAPEQVQISAGRSVSVRASALSDDHLDIPAFIRKQSE